jgi:hypothetical protein
VADWLSVWPAELKRVQELTFAARREWLRRLGVEVTVAKAGSGLPRYEIALNLPLDNRETLRRDPKGTSSLVGGGREGLRAVGQLVRAV